jgi:hypothetical protein
MRSPPVVAGVKRNRLACGGPAAVKAPPRTRCENSRTMIQRNASPVDQVLSVVDGQPKFGILEDGLAVTQVEEEAAISAKLSGPRRTGPPTPKQPRWNGEGCVFLRVPDERVPLAVVSRPWACVACFSRNVEAGVRFRTRHLFSKVGRADQRTSVVSLSVDDSQNHGAR